MDILIDLLTTAWLGKPAWVWLLFAGVVVCLLALDLGVLHRTDREIGVRESLALSAGYIGAASLFGVWVWWYLGAQSGTEYFTGFLIEKSLSMDNVFVIAMIFSYLAIPRQFQHRVLFWGIVGVIVLRALMIGAGAALIHQFSWVLYLFGGLLVLTGIKMWRASDHLPDITSDPFIVYTSNIFAILGLRALYFALAAMVHRFKYLKYALAAVLVFIGLKIFSVGLIGTTPPELSLGVTFGLIASGVLWSLWKTRGPGTHGQAFMGPTAPSSNQRPVARSAP